MLEHDLLLFIKYKALYWICFLYRLGRASEICPPPGVLGWSVLCLVGLSSLDRMLVGAHYL